MTFRKNAKTIRYIFKNMVFFLPILDLKKT
jgi:hypothetical protein